MRRLGLVVSGVDLSYISYTRKFLEKHFNAVCIAPKEVTGKASMIRWAEKQKLTHLATTNLESLKWFNNFLQGSQKDNVGTVLESDGYRFCLLPSLRNTRVTNQGAFLLEHFTKKLAYGGILKKDKFTWGYITPDNIDEIEQRMHRSFVAAIDIETERQHRLITSVAYSFWDAEDNKIYNCVLRPESGQIGFFLSAMRRLNLTECPKIFQNGKYDNCYFLRLRAPVKNWIYDTYHFNHCMYSEFPKDLAFISSFFLDNYVYWKDESSQNLYEYNAKDTHNTLWVFLAQVLYASTEAEYAFPNFTQNIFPVIFPAIQCMMEGLQKDESVRLQMREEAVALKENAKTSLELLLNLPEFNPGSPKQVRTMMTMFGADKNLKTDEKSLNKWREGSPLAARLVDRILQYRQATKAIGTYFDTEFWHDKLFFSLDPSGTETGRMASNESVFWCGANVQNQPPYARKMYKAEEGWTFMAVDKSQSESYCTAYLSEDSSLLRTVNESADFHCQNASLFFGIPFEELYDVGTQTVLNKAIRTLSKRVNHGANYNMGAYTLWQTMGTGNVLHAKELLKLPASMGVMDVCAYLMKQFDRAYPKVRKDWYHALVREVTSTGMLHIPAINYTRRTFLQPLKSKPDMNTLVAHKPQSLSVALVNRAFVKVWRKLQIEKYPGKFRLKMQVHDEIVAIGVDELWEQQAKEVADLMVIPTKINERTMTIPSTIAHGKYWSEAK